MTGEQIAARARACIGVRFRPQGRDVVAGLDCIGLVAHALAVDRVRNDYALRGGSLRELESGLVAAGLHVPSEAQAGDVLVMRCGAEQLHLGIWTGGGLVHADAGLGRVAERPGSSPWPVLRNWRLNGELG
jgi:cell wall-associated NlpC family hydrolase